MDGHGQQRDQGGQDGGAVGQQHGAAAAQGVEEGSGEDAAQAVAHGEHAHQGGGQGGAGPHGEGEIFAKEITVLPMAARKMMHRKARQKVKRRSIWPVV